MFVPRHALIERSILNIHTTRAEKNRDAIPAFLRGGPADFEDHYASFLARFFSRLLGLNNRRTLSASKTSGAINDGQRAGR